jgi:signal transduction histidine kinase
MSQDIVSVCRETIVYLQKRTGTQVIWKLDFPQQEIILPLNASLLSWTIENLVKNGLDAMKGIGSLGVSIQEQKYEVRILVQDQGNGILPKVLKKIFRPGFTTKSRGWGLGLSLAKRIVHDYHQGSIQVKESKLGQGTTFEIRLPKT